MTQRTTFFLTTLALLTSSAALPSQATVPAPQPVIEVQHLQGTWEGAFVVGDTPGKITLRFEGNSLRFQGPKPGDWYEATFTLKEGVLPQQMVATITGSNLPRDVGKVVDAVLKIEDGTLFLAGLDPDGEEQLEVFGDGGGSFKIGDTSLNLGLPGAPQEPRGFTGNRMFSYKFQKAQSPAKKVGATKPR